MDQKSIPAFPTTDPNYEAKYAGEGMTLRDYFAAKAMQAMIAAYPCQAIDPGDGGIMIPEDDLAQDAYEMADAMLAAR